MSAVTSEPGLCDTACSEIMAFAKSTQLAPLPVLVGEEPLNGRSSAEQDAFPITCSLRTCLALGPLIQAG